ncbi:MAG TPA: MBL fold metallo-hydrolase, partial [Gammaproteobacteria bacterium]|nr:MBL fold metallo-hydrolase [Gammaproteobacteria bacterium]
MPAEIVPFFHAATSTFSYVVSDPATRRSAVIDPVLDYDAAAGRADTASAQAIVDYMQKTGLALDWILETHAHADHLSAAPYFKQALGGTVAIGEGIRKVQTVFAKLFNIEAELPVDGSQFDRLFKDGDTF